MKIAERKRRAEKRKRKIQARVKELKATGFNDHQIAAALEKEFEMDQQRAWIFAHGRIKIGPDNTKEKHGPQFLRDWEAES